MAHDLRLGLSDWVTLTHDDNATKWIGGHGFHGSERRGDDERDGIHVGLYQLNIPRPGSTREPKIHVYIEAIPRNESNVDRPLGNRAAAVRVPYLLNTVGFNEQPSFAESRMTTYRLPTNCWYRIVASKSDLANGETVQVQFV